MRWRLERDRPRWGVLHQEPTRHFRTFVGAWLAGWWYCQRFPWGAAYIHRDAPTGALPPGPGGPYRALT